ncbi:MAG: hypothetical protein NTW87_07585 [Planctomycetota bacterium]|nr:hypothetical protein [Planctomycetota bacterium]
MNSTDQPQTVDPTTTEVTTPLQDGDSGAAAKKCSLCGKDVAHRWRVKRDNRYYCHGCCLKRKDLKQSKKLALRNAIIVVVAVVVMCVAILLLLHFMDA